MNTLVIQNLGGSIEDEIFSSDVGSWNVSMAQRDCEAGKHPLARFNIAEVYTANVNIEVDEKKITQFMQNLQVLLKPPICIIENDRAWLIDGHHRMRALHRLGIQEFNVYVIEDSAPYQILFNGKRVLIGDIK